MNKKKLEMRCFKMQGSTDVFYSQMYKISDIVFLISFLIIVLAIISVVIRKKKRKLISNKLTIYKN